MIETKRIEEYKNLGAQAEPAFQTPGKKQCRVSFRGIGNPSAAEGSAVPRAKWTGFFQHLVTLSRRGVSRQEITFAALAMENENGGKNLELG